MDVAIGTSIGLVQVFAGHPLDTIKTLLQNGQGYKKLRFKQLYRGWTYPAVASVVYNAVAFPVYRTCLEEYNPYQAGFIAGVAVSPVDYGFSVGKIRRQCVRPQPIHFKGFTMCSLRTVFASVFYFGIYEDYKHEIGPLCAGGLAGLASWTFTYPCDILATRQIAGSINIRQAFAKGSLWKGYLPCAIRAIFVNSLSFKLYDIIG